MSGPLIFVNASQGNRDMKIKSSPEEEGLTIGSHMLRERPVRITHRSSSDDLLGKGILLLVVLLLISGTGFFVLIGYRIGQTKEESRESIESLATVSVTEESGNEIPSDVSMGEEVSENPIEKGTVSVTVLNGGAAKGSAGKVADILKKAGFTRTEVGNTTGNYTGVTVYHKAESEREADAVRDSLVASYTEAKVSSEDAKQPETGVSSVTVILGK
jgi:hypothetical protein